MDPKAMSLISLPFEIISTTNNTKGVPNVQFKKDMVLFLQGVIPPDADRFEINFKTGPSPIDNIAFHYNPRLNDRTALNSFKDGSWGTEEFISSAPFTKGGAFIILVAVTSDSYEVLVNGAKHCTFQHRIPLEDVFIVNIRGKVAIYNWERNYFFCLYITKESDTEFNLHSSIFIFSDFISNQLPSISHKRECFSIEFSMAVMLSRHYSSDDIQHNSITSSEELTYSGNIAKELKEGMAMFLYGTLHEKAVSASIYFIPGINLPVYGFGYSLPVSKFTKGKTSQIILAFKSEGFEVYVNGSKYFTHKNHIPLDIVTTIFIPGSITVQFLGFVENWKNP